MNIEQNINLVQEIVLNHEHNEVRVPFVLDSDPFDSKEKVAPTRTVIVHGGAYRCPQCGTRIVFELTSTIDATTDAGGEADVSYRA